VHGSFNHFIAKSLQFLPCNNTASISLRLLCLLHLKGRCPVEIFIKRTSEEKKKKVFLFQALLVSGGIGPSSAMPVKGFSETLRTMEAFSPVLSS